MEKGIDMICSECGGNYRKSADPLELNDKYIGKLAIKGISYLICEGCGGILYPPETTRKIDFLKKERTQELIRDFSLSSFISSSETTELLGVSKQALSKNRRISRGFIYRTVIGNITLYLKRSVIQYKMTGDGRFPLFRSEVPDEGVCLSI